MTDCGYAGCPIETTPVTPVVSVPTDRSSMLPDTGADTTPMVHFALVLLAIGVALLALQAMHNRRKRAVASDIW